MVCFLLFIIFITLILHSNFRYKGTKELSDGLKYNITREGDKCILVINNATPDDVDEYCLKAKNPAGSRMTRCNVNVRCKFVIQCLKQDFSFMVFLFFSSY